MRRFNEDFQYWEVELTDDQGEPTGEWAPEDETEEIRVVDDNEEEAPFFITRLKQIQPLPREDAATEDSVRNLKVDIPPLKKLSKLPKPTVKFIETIFDIVMQENIKTKEFNQNKNKIKNKDSIVFCINNKLMMTSRDALKNSITSLENIGYECSQRFRRYFEAENIYKYPYYNIKLVGNYYVPVEDIVNALSHNYPFWMLEKVKTLDFTASRQGVIAGGPIESSDHCQDGTNKILYKLAPFAMIEPASEIHPKNSSMYKKTKAKRKTKKNKHMTKRGTALQNHFTRSR